MIVIELLFHLNIPDNGEEGNHHVKAWGRHTLQHGPSSEVDSDMSLLDPVEAVLLGNSLTSSRRDSWRLTWTATPNTTTRPATAARGFMARITRKKVAQSENIFIITSFAVHIRDFLVTIIL